MPSRPSRKCFWLGKNNADVEEGLGAWGVIEDVLTHPAGEGFL